MDHAEKEFEKYEMNRRVIEAREPTSDFDKMVKNLPAPVTKMKKK